MKKERTIIILLSFVISYLGMCKGSNTLTYLGRSKTENVSYTRYSSWQSTDKLAFEFVTGNPNGLLLHVGDSNSTEWTRNYIQLIVRNGMPNLISRIKNRTNTKVIMKRAWHAIEVDDMKWHKLKISLDGNIMQFAVGEERSFLRIGPVKLTGALYIGGLPYRSSISCKLNRYYQFVGAIRNVKYNKIQNGGNLVVETKGTDSGYVNRCSMSHRRGRLCEKGGAEVNGFDKCSCNCLGTGFEGSRCEQVSTPVKLNGLDIIKWRPSPSQTSSEANEIKLAFKTYEPSGILVYIGNSTKYLMVELFRGILMVRIRLDTSKENLSLILSKRRLNDNCWHLIEVSRRALQLKASLNRTLIWKVTIDANIVHQTLSDSEISIGGKRYLDALSGSRSKQDFMGCLREIHYNGENIGKTIMDTYRRTTDKRLKILGRISKGCPTRPTKAPFTQLPRSKRQRPTFHRHTKHNQKRRHKKDTSNRSSRLKKISGAPQTILIIGTVLGILVLIIVVAATVHYIKRRYHEELALSAIFTRTPTETGTSSGTMHMHVTPSSSGEKNDRFRETRD